jgi:predicted nucleotidyltransferase
MSALLGQLADEVGVSERTLRRAVGGDLIRARRLGSRGLLLSEDEADWVRGHWTLVAELREALRTEPNVGLAVLFGSVARGDETAGNSDVDLLVGLRGDSPGALEALRGRLGGRLAVEVQVVPLEAARRNVRLALEVARDGRPLVDRERAWSGLRADMKRRGAALSGRLEDESRAEARAAVDYFRALAGSRRRARVPAA